MQMAGLVCAQTTSYTELNNLVVIYHHTNAGDLPGTIVQDLQVSLDIASLFYWRNSHMSVLPRWTIFEVTDYMDIVENNGYIYPSTVDADLHDRGFTDDTYDAVHVVAVGSGNFAWGVYRCLGKGGYCQTGWWGSGYGSWATAHEYNHVVDSMFNYSGYPSYPHNHPGAARYKGEHVPNSGPDWDLNAWIFRDWPRANWLALPGAGDWGTTQTTADVDGDGVPDNDPTVPLDEDRLGSMVDNPDSDGDGLNDLGEAMAGIFTQSDPMSTDSDGDGVLDGHDSFPIYPLATDTPYGTLTLDDPLPTWPLSGLYYHDKPQDMPRTKLRLGWDDDHLFVGVVVGNPSAGRIRVHLDCDADGFFHGPDNLEIILDGEVIEDIILRDADAVTGQGDHVVSHLPTTGYSCRTNSGSNWKNYKVIIPKDSPHGLDLTVREEIGIRIIVDNYGRMFEPDDYFVMELVHEPEQPVIIEFGYNASGNIEITWTSETGILYRIDASTDPYNGSMTWETAADDIAGQAGSTTWEDTSGAPMTQQKFYRVCAKSGTMP